MVNFEVGDSSYIPMLLHFDNVGSSGAFTVKAVHGLHPSIGSSGISPAHTVNHYWAVANNGAAGPTTVKPKGTYQLSDIIGGSNSYFATQQYFASAWYGSALASTNTSSPYTTATAAGILLANTSGDYIFGRVASALDVNPVAAAHDLNVFPNPNTGVFTVSLSSAYDESAAIIISNILGEKIKEITTTTNTETEIRLNVPAGLYMVSVSTAHGNYVSKVTVK